MTCFDTNWTPVRMIALAAALAVAGAGCSEGEVDEPAVGMPSAAPLRNGSNQTGRMKGIVEITNAYDGRRCSGVMLNMSTILTSARCLRRFMRPGATTANSLGYQVDLYSWNEFAEPPGMNKHCSTFQSERCRGTENVKQSKLMVYSLTASADKDLAILSIDPYPNYAYEGDFADIYMDDFTPASMPRLQFYGWGRAGPTDPYPLSEPRKGTMQVLTVTSGRIDLRPDQVQACSGDEGGAWTIPDTGGASVNEVVAIESSFTRDPSTGCSQIGSTDRATRLRDKMSWVESIIGPCGNFTDFAGHNIKRCYDINCNGAPAQEAGWDGCRGSGCAVCSEVIDAYPKYFEHHRNCSRNTTCAGQFFRCSSNCPPPTDADR